MPTISIELNGQPFVCEVDARTHLADLLREEARLTGTHLGCEHGVCGACTVLIDGRPVRSCISFAVACDGASITTIEGYGDDPVMALLRAAFSRHHALQCGYCTPGMLATARDIVLRWPEADEVRVRHELAGNLCRCTGYMGIVAAILDVLAQTANGTHPAVDVLRGTQQRIAAAAAQSGGFAAFDAVDDDRTSPGVARRDAAVEEVTDGGTRVSDSFTVPFAPAAVWQFMADLPAVAACLPGAELGEHSADHVKGQVVMRFGPMAARFVGAARLERDDAVRRAVLKGSGKDTLSQSRATGDVAYRLVDLGSGSTRVDVDLHYTLQGPLAQFSRSGLVRDFIARLILEFGNNVTHRMDPAHAGESSPPAKLHALRLGLSVLWARIRRWFGTGG